jgi:hypothetical protein
MTSPSGTQPRPFGSESAISSFHLLRAFFVEACTVFSVLTNSTLSMTLEPSKILRQTTEVWLERKTGFQQQNSFRILPKDVGAVNAVNIHGF